ncbi:TolB family protein, partial [Candidatus Protofrankia californiensis]|uniref:TolB family protein n=1 Tax=Candidatus Protofrankia californiensis TaxID=1839754 RepID=UPI003D34BF30
MIGNGVAVGSPERREPGGRLADLVDDWVAAASCFSPSLGSAGEVAYVSDRDGTPRLWLRDVTGVEWVVDTGAGHVRSVVCSPGGAWIAVVVAPGGGEYTEVRVVRPDGSGLRRLAGGWYSTVPGPGLGPAAGADTGAGPGAVEPGGAHAAFTTPAVVAPPFPPYLGGDGSMAGRAAGSVAGAEADTASAATLGRWTPDGTAVAVCESVGSGMTHALLVDPETGRRDHLAVGQALAVCDIDGDAASGYRLLLREGPRGVRRLILVDSATGRFHPLLDGTGTVGLGRFAADVTAPATDAASSGSSGGTVAYVLSDAGRERAALVAVTLGNDFMPKSVDVVAARDDADLERFALLPGGFPTGSGTGSGRARPAAVLAWNVDGQTVLDVVDLNPGGSGRPRSRRALPSLPREVAGSLLVRDGGRGLLLALVGSTVPGELWTYDFVSASAGYRCLVSHAPTAFPVPALASVSDPDGVPDADPAIPAAADPAAGPAASPTADQHGDLATDIATATDLATDIATAT